MAARASRATIRELRLSSKGQSERGMNGQRKRAVGDGPRTTALVSAQLLGAAWACYVIRIEPIASASRAEVAAWIGPAIGAYITGQFGKPAEPRP